eukprot:1194203-Prorocentrum_minimum.AAC.1
MSLVVLPLPEEASSDDDNNNNPPSPPAQVQGPAIVVRDARDAFHLPINFERWCPFFARPAFEVYW